MMSQQAEVVALGDDPSSIRGRAPSGCHSPLERPRSMTAAQRRDITASRFLTDAITSPTQTQVPVPICEPMKRSQS